MAQSDIANSIQILQNMINIVLVKTGNSFRSHRKDGSISQNIASTGNPSSIPNAVENFHMALDDLETEILLCKATLSRDLENLRSKHKAFEDTSAEISDQKIDSQELDGALTAEISDFVNVKGEKETGTFNELQDNSENHHFKTLTDLNTQDLGLEAIGNSSNQNTHSKSSNINTHTLQDTIIHDQKIAQEEVLEASASVISNPDNSSKPSPDSLFDESVSGNLDANSMNNLGAGFQSTTEEMLMYSQIQTPNFKSFGPGQSSQNYNAICFQNLGNPVTTTSGYQDSNFLLGPNTRNNENILPYDSNGTHNLFSQGFFGQGP